MKQSLYNKRALAILLLCICILPTKAQNYVPFPDSNCVWNVGWSSNASHIIKIHGDSVLNNLQYKKYYISYDTSFTNAQYTFKALIRQDNLSKRVYGVSNGSNQEKLLYDFSLNVNDTISVNTLLLVHGFPRVKVVAKDSILIAGQFRKRLTLTSGYSWSANVLYERWIEGVGSDFGVFLNGLCSYVVFDVCYPKLNCQTVNGQLVYGSNGHCFSQPCGTGVGNAETSMETATEVVIYPNPGKGLFTVSLPYQKRSSEFRLAIYDIMGSQIRNLIVHSDTKVDLSDLADGIYLLKVFTSHGQEIYRSKLIKQD